MTVVSDLTRSEDWLSIKPGYAVGGCHVRRLPSVHEAQILWPEKDSGVQNTVEWALSLQNRGGSGHASRVRGPGMQKSLGGGVGGLACSRSLC